MHVAATAAERSFSVGCRKTVIDLWSPETSQSPLMMVGTELRASNTGLVMLPTGIRVEESGVLVKRV